LHSRGSRRKILEEDRSFFKEGWKIGEVGWYRKGEGRGGLNGRVDERFLKKIEG